MKRSVLRFAGRMAMFAVVSCGLVLVGVQFEGIVAKNVAMANDVTAAHVEIAALQARAREQRRTLRRLSTPDGAIPEIHSRLRLVGPHEEIIYVRGATSPDIGAAGSP